MLGLRRLISLKTQIEPKKKIFDASLWFFAASLFQPYLVLLMLVVFYAVVEYTLYDAKNFFIPLIAWICGALFFTAFKLIQTDEWQFFYEAYTDFGWNNFRLIWQENPLFICIFSLFSLFILFSIFKIISGVALALKTSLNLILLSFIVVLVGWAFAEKTQIDALGIAVLPLSMLAGNVFQLKIKPVLKEVLFLLLLVLSLSSFLGSI